MMSLRHPNITQIFGGCWPPPEEEDGEEDRFCNLFSTCIVMEYCELGEFSLPLQIITSSISM